MSFSTANFFSGRTISSGISINFFMSQMYKIYLIYKNLHYINYIQSVHFYSCGKMCNLHLTTLKCINIKQLRKNVERRNTTFLNIYRTIKKYIVLRCIILSIIIYKFFFPHLSTLSAAILLQGLRRGKVNQKVLTTSFHTLPQ